MGRKIVLTGTTLTDTTAPKLLTIDPIESSGSLLLIDPMHPVEQWTAGVPASGAMVPNLVAANAATVYGSTPDDPTVTYANLDGTTTGLVERSTMGGLHGIVSQDDSFIAAPIGTLPHVAINMDAALREWQYLHPTNDLYVSMWGRVTRAFRSGTIGGTYTTGATLIQYMITSANNRRVSLGEARNTSHSDLGRRDIDEEVTGNVFGNAASSAWGTNPASATGVQATLITIGGITDANTYVGATSTARGRWPSYVIYRVYVEDLTVSGRTYAEVDAIDHALYTKEVLTAGGRYYGDTFTDPATIP